MKNLKFFGGILLIFLGVFIGLYCGLWWAFIGGIIQIIEQIRAPEMSVSILALGIVKVLFAGLIGWVSALVFIIPGGAMASK